MAQIVLDGVTVTAPGDDETTILGETSLRLTERRIALIGGNGSGKSTLARLLNGLTAPATGSVRVDDLDTVRDGAAVRRRVGFVFTDPDSQLVMPTCAEDVALSLRRTRLPKAERRERAVEILGTYGLAHLADVSVHSLSGGQKQLLAVAGVLATDPDVIVADEPTTLLDLHNTRRIADLLFGLRQQVVLVTHDLELATRCDRALVIAGGVVAFDGDPAEAAASYRESVSR